MQKSAAAVFCLIAGSLQAQVTVSMSQYDAERTSANLQEAILNPSNVNPQQFGKLFSRQVDDTIYAQPLIVSGIEIGGTRRNVLFVATMSNSVYAFDADDAGRTQPFWKRTFGTPGYGDEWTGPTNWGILGTPYIDSATETMYVVAKVRNGNDSGLFLHALDLKTGQGKFNSPQRLTFSFANGPTVSNVGKAIQRAGLLMVNDTLVIAFANILPESDRETQEGFIQSFDARDLSKRLATFQVTPTGLKGGIWQAGRGVSADSDGNIYVATAGGSYNGTSDFGSSVLKLSAKTLTLLDWFTPNNHEDLYHRNIDPSANGVTLIPGTSLLFAGGKEGVLYLLDRARLGHLETAETAPLQRFKASEGCGISDCSQTLGTAFWNRGEEGLLYLWDRGDVLRAYRFANQRFETAPFSKSTVKPVMTGGPTLSANGSDLGSGIVWAVTVNENANDKLVPGTLRAFLASDLTKEIYNSDSNRGRDAPGDFTKFAAPVVANGKVYVATHSSRVSVYGLLRNTRAQIEAVTNTADYSQRIAYHSLASIFGQELSANTCAASVVPLPNELCGVTVRASNNAGAEALAPLLYVSPSQINFQMPFTQFTSGKDPVRRQAAAATVELCVLPVSSCTLVPVSAQAPAIFGYQRAPGIIDPIITHLDGSLVTPQSPAKWEETLVLYATGYGYQNSGFPNDGFPAPADRLVELSDVSTVHIESGRSAGVSVGTGVPAAFAGLAPGFVGLHQINFSLANAQRRSGDVFLFLKGATEGQSRTVRLYLQ